MPRHGHTGLLDVAGAFAAAYLAGVSVICVLLQEWVRRRPRDLAQVVDLPDVTMERVGSVCDRRLTDAAKAASNSR